MTFVLNLKRIPKAFTVERVSNDGTTAELSCAARMSGVNTFNKLMKITGAVRAGMITPPTEQNKMRIQISTRRNLGEESDLGFDI